MVVELRAEIQQASAGEQPWGTRAEGSAVVLD